MWLWLPRVLHPQTSVLFGEPTGRQPTEVQQLVEYTIQKQSVAKQNGVNEVHLGTMSNHLGPRCQLGSDLIHYSFLPKPNKWREQRGIH